MRLRVSVCCVALLSLASWGVLAPPPTSARLSRVFFQKGVNFTAEWPAGYAPAAAAAMLDKLRPYGVNAIALVPYGAARRGEPVLRYSLGMERADLIEAVARVAHQRGIRVLLKPQVWVRGGFPGDLDFPNPSERARWFSAYRGFLEFYARLASRCQADVFCVGVEFGKLTRYETEWRSLIERARELYSGPLTYAANPGPEFETLRFWDALDYIGLNDYYPLPDDLSPAEVVRKVAAVQQRFRRPVLFTEVGFSTFEAPQRAPWDETPRKLAPQDQARCYEAVFRAFYAQPWFAGMYWWKVGTDGGGGPDDGGHTPWGKPAMEIVAKWYRSGRR
ncbi:MAG TPA: hypothetical protein VFA33_01425 [Bryobacteraceae bacterium]|nr:hypothetical protein [Bryobacteraceae bacterium]